jgi:LysM repeat protein
MFTILAGVFALGAFFGALWLIKPWAEISSAPAGRPGATQTLSAMLAQITPATPTRTVAPTLTPKPKATATTQPTASLAPTITLTPTRAGPITHTVASGDTLGSIAVQYDSDSEEIAKANNITVYTTLDVGQKLIIPAPTPGGSGPAPTATDPSRPTPTKVATALPAAPTAGPVTHQVAQGDTLGSIAVEYDTTSDDIATANGISVNTMLSIGQKLKIPVTPKATTPPTPVLATVAPTLRASITATLNLTGTLRVAPTAILTATASFTDTLDLSATLGTPVPDLPYLAPHLLAPSNGSEFSDTSTYIVLNWASVGILADNEWYRLSLWRSEDDVNPVQVWIRATSWRVPLQYYPEKEPSARFLWQVTVMLRNSERDAGVAISLPSETYEFTWR